MQQTEKDSVRDKPYQEWFLILNMHSKEYRRRGYIIQLYKIMQTIDRVDHRDFLYSISI